LKTLQINYFTKETDKKNARIKFKYQVLY